MSILGDFELNMNEFVHSAAHKSVGPVEIKDFPCATKVFLVGRLSESVGFDIEVIAETKEDVITYIKEQYDDAHDQWRDWDQDGEQQVGMNRIIEVDMNMTLKQLRDLL